MSALPTMAFLTLASMALANAVSLVLSLAQEFLLEPAGFKKNIERRQDEK